MERKRSAPCVPQMATLNCAQIVQDIEIIAVQLKAKLPPLTSGWASTRPNPFRLLGLLCQLNFSLKLTLPLPEAAIVDPSNLTWPGPKTFKYVQVIAVQVKIKCPAAPAIARYLADLFVQFLFRSPSTPGLVHALDGALLVKMQVQISELVSKFSFALLENDAIRARHAITLMPLMPSGKKGGPMRVTRVLFFVAQIGGE
ncbi:hypothetical protein C8J57DRAFT_1239967 [Mycena rebaudengoi]|nr:hypothetical protein C8J57DRAFT_1239967 [Mycena rebaudengoi]